MNPKKQWICEELSDGLSDMIEDGRISRSEVPDDYDWLVETLIEFNRLMFPPTPGRNDVLCDGCDNPNGAVKYTPEGNQLCFKCRTEIA